MKKSFVVLSLIAVVILFYACTQQIITEKATDIHTSKSDDASATASLTNANNYLVFTVYGKGTKTITDAAHIQKIIHYAYRLCIDEFDPLQTAPGNILHIDGLIENSPIFIEIYRTEEPFTLCLNNKNYKITETQSSEFVRLFEELSQ
jgi:hypothetical protein